MIRGLFDAAVLFLIPFVVYAAVLVMRRRYPFVLKVWSEGPLGRLVVAGLALAIVGTLAAGLLGGQHRGAYVPAHLDHGVLVPGRME